PKPPTRAPAEGPQAGPTAVDGPERLRRAGAVAWSVVGLAALVGLIGALAWLVRVIWPPLMLAGAIVFLLNPLVTALHARHLPRALGTGLTYLGFFAVTGLAALVMIPLASEQAEDLSDELPQVRRDIEDWVNDRADQSEDWIVSIPRVSEIEDEVESQNRRETPSDRLDRVLEIGGRVFHVAIILVLAPIVAFYLLVDLPRIRVAAEALVPPGRRAEVLTVAHQLNAAIGGFFRGQLLVATIVGLIVSVGLALIDLPFWLIVGMIAGLFNIVPLIGPWVGAVPGIVIAISTRDVGTAVWVAGIMAGAQQLDNHFISPLVMRRTVHLHPAAVMLALLAGGTIAGFLGLLLAVPVAATLKILAVHLWRTYVLGQPVADQGTAGPEPAEVDVVVLSSGSDQPDGLVRVGPEEPGQ
ncbi:MAG: AI-2E family transporter, partial [Actinomycetota bacterium]|nr:AI-2E family transporter [Actinomycetota bacterium]